MAFPDDWIETILPVKEKYNSEDLVYATTMLRHARERANAGCSTTPEETWRWREMGLVIDYRLKADPHKAVVCVFFDKTRTVMQGWRFAWYTHTFDDPTLVKEVLAGALGLLTRRLASGEIPSQGQCHTIYFGAQDTDATPHAETFRQLEHTLAERAGVEVRLERPHPEAESLQWLLDLNSPIGNTPRVNSPGGNSDGQVSDQA